MSFEVSDVLIRIRQCVNGIQGFDECLENYKDNDEKMDTFVKQCQYLIEKGWDDCFQAKYFCQPADTEENDEIGFLGTVLKPLLVNPAQNVFNHKKISGTDEKVIQCFTRLALFRLLFDAYKNNSCVENGNVWFVQMKSALDKEFASLCNKQIMYRGKILENAKDFDDAEVKAKNIIVTHRNGMNNTLMMLFALAFIARLSWNLPPDVRKGVACFVFASMLCLMVYKLKDRLPAMYFFSQFEKYSEGMHHKELGSNQDIKKFFFIPEFEMEQLKRLEVGSFENDPHDTNRQQSLGKLKMM